MRWHKKILRNPKLIYRASQLIAAYIGWVFKTTRWQYEGFADVQPLWDEKKPFIVAFWHNRLMMTTFAWQSATPFHMLISAHQDGQIIAQTVGHYGIKTIHGSTSKGGSTAVKAMLKVLRRNEVVGITPDGPRGPRFHTPEGPVRLASLAQCPILPVTFATSRRVVLNSWDRFILPLPFGRGMLAWSKPIAVPRELSENDVKSYCNQVTEALKTLCDQADIFCGHQPLR